MTRIRTLKQQFQYNKTEFMNTQEHHELYEKARKRVRQKKHLVQHFVFLLLGATLMFVLNKIVKVGEQFGDWYQWVMALWFFVWLFHVIQVFVTHRFFGKDWERSETDKLIAKHMERLQSLEKKLENTQQITPNNSDQTTQNH